MLLTNEKVKSTLLGFLIGLAVIIPGFSGAQIAIMFRLYDKLMAALGNLFKKKSILFLLPIILGAIVGFILGLFTVRFLLKLSLFAVVAFFAGLMVGGLPTITKEVKGKAFKKTYIVNLIIGLIIPITLSVAATNANWNLAGLLENTPWYMYLICLLIGGAVALTQLIPGLSATALLMSFGLYDALMQSVSVTYWKENPMILLVYIALVIGAIAGVLLIAKLINKLLNNYKIGFYYVIIGLCISSIISMFYNPEITAFYKTFEANWWGHIVAGIVLFIFGAAIVLYTSLKEKPNNNVEIEEDTIQKYNN